MSVEESDLEEETRPSAIINLADKELPLVEKVAHRNDSQCTHWTVCRDTSEQMEDWRRNTVLMGTLVTHIDVVGEFTETHPFLQVEKKKVNLNRKGIASISLVNGPVCERQKCS